MREGFILLIWKSAEVIAVSLPKIYLAHALSKQTWDQSPCFQLWPQFWNRLFSQFWSRHLTRNNTDAEPNIIIYYRPKISTTNAVMTINGSTTLDRGGPSKQLILKTFDIVNHNLLLRKLLNKNVPHYLIKWFFSYLDQRSQRRVRIGTDYSGWLHLNGAMPQGSWLGPLSFLVLHRWLNTV